MFKWIEKLNLNRDPDTKDLPPVTKPLSLAEAERKFGRIVAGTWADERKHMVLLEVPRPHLLNTTTGKHTSRIYINEYVAPALMHAFKNVLDRGQRFKLKSFDGCLNIRPIRGSTTLSTHAYGLAIDINAKGNGLGETPAIDPDLVKCFTDAGWIWGGTFKRKDGMHFQIAAW